jgi:hypothetical protein
VLFELLGSGDSNISFFAASRVSFVARLLKLTNETAQLARLLNRLADLRSQERLEDESNELIDQCLTQHAAK